MSYLYNNTIKLKFQQFESETLITDEKYSELIVEFDSKQSTNEIKCPRCNGQVEVHCRYTERLKDLPYAPKTPVTLKLNIHRYMCKKCEKTFTEKVSFKHRGTQITERMACWIRGLTKAKISVSSISNITGVHWDTIRIIQNEYMDVELCKRYEELFESGYKPTYLAIDEFAIHKGHKYATCVMDLDTGEVLWVGEGRSISSFSNFFKEIDMSYLSNVKAVAMDMNASFNKLVEEHMPWAEIIYDRFHMQSQFGKDVLGVVRLQEAKKHQLKAKELSSLTNSDIDKKELKQSIKDEKKMYRSLKRSRWPLLMNSNNLSETRSSDLNSILESHHDLAICYAMKEEMNRLFELSDPIAAEFGWISWFEAAKTSGIEPLVKFALLKEKRLPGLIAHSKHNISTGKLEGFNNKIKVAKRDAYGFRNKDFFFKLIRFLSIPSIRSYT